jgi:DNA-binding FadR family transcriptional regulator
MKAYSVALRIKVVESVMRGISKSETARRFRISRSTVNRFLKRLEERAALLPRSRDQVSVRRSVKVPCGCSRKTSLPGHGQPTGRGASSSSEYVELRLARQQSAGRSSAWDTAEKEIGGS